MDDSVQKSHHVREDLCTTRPSYREGRKLKAVKVYTVSQESQYLLVQGVPGIKLKAELETLFSSHGQIADCQRIENYPAEQFSEVFLLKFTRIQSARFAKKFLDDYNFYGGVLHICYAPEYESIEETSKKLQERQKSVTRRVRQLEREAEESCRHQNKMADISTSSSIQDDRASVTGTRTEEDESSSLRDATATQDTDEHPVLIEIPEEFFSAPIDQPAAAAAAAAAAANCYPALPPPPSMMPGYMPLPVYPSQVTNPPILSHEQSFPTSFPPYYHVAPPQ